MGLRPAFRRIFTGMATAIWSSGTSLERMWASLPALKVDLGRRWTAERKLLVCYVGAMAIIGVVAVVVNGALDRSAGGMRSALLINQIIKLNETLVYDAQTAAAAQQAFLLTGNDHVLLRYARYSDAFQQTAGELHGLVLGNPKRVGQVKAIRREFEKWRTDVAEPGIAARRLAPTHLAEVTEAAHAVALQLRREADAGSPGDVTRGPQWTQTVDALRAQIRVGLSLETNPAAIPLWKTARELADGLAVPTTGTRSQADRIEETLRARQTAAVAAQTDAARAFSARTGAEIDDIRYATIALTSDEEKELRRVFDAVRSATGLARATALAGSLVLLGLLFGAMIEFRVVSERVDSQAREMSLLNQLGELLHACGSFDESWVVITRFARWLFPEEAGAIYLISPSRDLAERVVDWGSASAGRHAFPPDQCWAVRRGQVHLVEDIRLGMACHHLSDPLPQAYACLPLVAQNDMLGILVLLKEPAAPKTASALGSRLQLARTFAEQIGSAVSNLRLRETLRHQSIRDPLTGLFNRRYLEETLERELRRADRHQSCVGAIMFDIDQFKQFNDSLGHDAGDALLRELGNALQEEIRKEDIACRYGGEEFVLILPDISFKDAVKRAEHLQEMARRMDVIHRGRALGNVTLSLGVAVYPEHGKTGEAVLRAADAALYRAKQNGRDRVEVA